MMAYARVLIIAIAVVIFPTETGWNLLDVELDLAADQLPQLVTPLDTTIVRPADMPQRSIPEEIPQAREYEHI